MSNKQTAVDWLFHKLWDTPKDKFNWYAILKKAEEMEKEQIMKAIEMYYPHSGRTRAAEKYYNETYGN